MVCNRVFACLGLLVLSLAVGPAITSGQPCDDFDECTDNDVCVVDPDLGNRAACIGFGIRRAYRQPG